MPRAAPPEARADAAPRDPRRERRRVFDEIRSIRAWGNGESASGPGSSRERASAFLPELVALVRQLGVTTLLDAPCGDFNWAAPLAESVTCYVGVDIVPALVLANRRRFGSPARRFHCRDIVSQRLPAADLVLCRDALVHLSLADALEAIGNFRRTGATYFVATTFTGDRDNTDVPNGAWRPLNLERPPFSFPRPFASVDERCHHSGGIYADKQLGVWRFADLPDPGRCNA